VAVPANIRINVPINSAPICNTGIFGLINCYYLARQRNMVCIDYIRLDYAYTHMNTQSSIICI
jgi:hypothetical protein